MTLIAIDVPDELYPRLVKAMRAQYPEHAAQDDTEAMNEVTASYWRHLLVAYEVAQTRASADAVVNEQQAQSQADASDIAGADSSSKTTKGS